MKTLILLFIFFIFACETSKPRYLYYGKHNDDYRAVISKIRDVRVNSRFNVQAIIKDDHNDTLTDRTEVELTLHGGDSDAVLRGTTERDTRRGKVTFSNLRIDRKGRNYRIKLTFDVDDEEFYSRSNIFDVIGSNDDDDDNGISIGGSLFSVDMEGMPDSITAGRALPDLIFTMKLLGNKSTGGAVTLRVRDEDGNKLDNALLAWRKPSLSASVRSGKAVFTETFFTRKLDEGAELSARTMRFIGTEEFYLPRVRPAIMTADVNRLTVNAGNTEVHGILYVEGSPCSNCTVNSYLVSNEKIKDASVTQTDNNGTFTAIIADWVCAAGTSYQGAVKVFYGRSNYYAMLRANCG